ncbi:enolase C-terminal domain-like protein [Nitratireductor basaltis]|uniref:L-alanine-DL-glutamate epimerase of enolase superfamily protein n=1 Tax=Nitratireductor basaltis TaxID=472175 RepID=A0A084UD50_9HYPH|nr:enolase C-terminal domain-like protein [Nitratireductor basaltis]KFB10886.1 L-alanine-DL-glutamate epimerase of enolase superfamily protein [Nitratireductor basaltis]
MTSCPRIRVVEAELFERDVPFRFAFRFGAAEVKSARQAFVRVRLVDEAGGVARGWSAEMMMPKWFDKNPALSPQDNAEQLRRSLHLAMQACLNAGSGTAFDLHTAVEAELHAACESEGLGGLIASFGLALVDRAIIDGICRHVGLPVERVVQKNLLGIDARTAPDLAGFPLDTFLSRRRIHADIAVRHTVGLGDALDASDLEQQLDDGLPQTLAQVIAAYGHRWFKLKIGGDVEADLARLERVAAILEREQPDYRATLDGNEQYRDEDHVLELLDGLERNARLAKLREHIVFLEQPIARARALEAPIGKLATRISVEVDESDASMDAFVRGKALGYSGVSSKSCKGFYRALLNRARVELWNNAAGRKLFFMSAEDLTTQAGLGLQQDLALAGLIGTEHVERNGHHFVRGMPGVPETELRQWAQAHGDLYRPLGQSLQLDIRDGRISLKSVGAATGLGASVEPYWAAMESMKREETAI